MSTKPPLPREWVEDPPLMITSREEQQEFLSRTPQDAASIETDLRGLSSRLLATTLSSDDVTEKGMVASRLKRLDAELARTPREKMPAFLAVKRDRPELVNDDHRASFLWREDFDVKLASQRLVNYWERRRELFGPENFSLPLTPEGALRDDVHTLRHSYCSLLPVKDKFGRSIIFTHQGLIDWTKYSAESMLRVVWYLFELALEESDTQRNGIVVVVYDKNASFRSFNHRYTREASKLVRCYLPVRLRSIHVCCPRPSLYLILPVAKFALGKKLRERLVVHFGTEEDCLLSLTKYGLPKDRIPSDMGGDLASVAVINGELHTGSVAPDSCISSGNRSFEPIAAISEVTKSMEGVESERSKARMKSRPKGIDTEPSKPACVTSGHDDPRMNHALEAALSNPKFSMLDAGLIAGFLFPNSGKQKLSSELVFGSDNVSLKQRKNQLTSRRRIGLTHSRGGRKGDPRMNKAVAAKLANPLLSNFDALKIGGFKFSGESMSELRVLDSENISLRQRKNQLARRLRMEKSKKELVAADNAMPTITFGGLKTTASNRGEQHNEDNTSFCSLEADVHTFCESQGNNVSGRIHSSCDVSSALEIKKREIQGAGVASTGNWNSASGMKPAVDDGIKPFETTDLPLDKSSACGPKNVDRQAEDDFFEQIIELPGLADLPGFADLPALQPKNL